MSIAHSTPPNQESQRWVVLLAVLQSLMLLVAHIAIEDDGWLAQSELRLNVWYSLTLVVPTSLLLLITDVRKKLPWFYGALLIVIVGTQAATASAQCNPDLAVDCGNILFPYALTLAVSSFLALPFAQAWQHQGRPNGNYQLLFEYSWHNALSLVLAAAFLGLFWLLLLLWAGLFSLLDISFFADLFAEETFIYPISGMVSGFGIAIARTRTELLANVREQSLFWIFKSLTPLLATIAVLFLLAIAISGVETLWATGTAGNLLAWLALSLIIFINAVFLNGQQQSHYPSAIRAFVNLALLGLPVIAALGLWAVNLRVGQYGWSVPRLWAAYVMGLLFIYGLGYAVAVISSALSKNSTWLAWIKPHNTAVALFIIASLTAINLGAPNFFGIAVNSQMQRLTTEQVSWQEFDFKHLRFEAGMKGYRAVEQFAANPSINISAHGQEYLAEILAAEHRWDVNAHPISQTETRLAINTRQGEAPTSALFSFIIEENYHATDCALEKNRCALVAVTLRRNGESDWLFMFQGDNNSSWTLYNEQNGEWKQVANMRPWGAGNAKAFDKVFAGDYQTSEPQWLDIDVGGEPIKVNH